MERDTSLEVDGPPDRQPGQTLLVGLASVGMAGVTAADFLVRRLDSEEIAHISPGALPAETEYR